MKIQYSSVLIILAVICLAQACQKQITIDLPAYEGKPVIECLLKVGATPKVFLSNSVPFFDSDITPSNIFIRDAQVIISGNGEEDILQIDSVFDNFFCRWQPFYAGQIATKTNVEYQLTVGINGKTYNATTTTDVQPVEMGEVSFTSSFQDVYGQHQGVVIDFTDPAGTDNYYRFHMTRDIDSTVRTIDDFEINAFCIGDGIITIEDLGWFIYSDENADGNETRLVMEPSHTFFEGDVAYVRLQTLDKNAAVYFDFLDKLKQASLNPFIEPVILKELQFDGATGYFGNANLSTVFYEMVFPEDND